VDLPALPSGYDPSGDWPADGAAGTLVVVAVDDDDPDLANQAEPLRRDLRVGQSLGTTFTWTGF
jgi:hypothetical protein